MSTFTLATLTIANFTTSLRLTGDWWQPGQPQERINVLGGDWDKDYVSFFRAAADKELAARGYARTGDWQYKPFRDVHQAPIARQVDR